MRSSLSNPYKQNKPCRDTISRNCRALKLNLFLFQDENVLKKLTRCLSMFTMAVSEPEMGEEIGSCLELLHDMLPDCDERKQILCALGVHTVNNNWTEKQLHSS